MSCVRVEDHPEPRADEGLVVDDQDADAAVVVDRGRPRLGRHRGHQLVDADGTLEVLEALLPEVDEHEAGDVVLLVVEEGIRRLGEADLAAVADAADPRRAVNGEALVLAVRDCGLTRVDAHPHP